MQNATCPICSQQFGVSATEAFPFCSERCRKIDLGRWLNEEYSVPYERSDDGTEILPTEERS